MTRYFYEIEYYDHIVKSVFRRFLPEYKFQYCSGYSVYFLDGGTEVRITLQSVPSQCGAMFFTGDLKYLKVARYMAAAFQYIFLWVTGEKSLINLSQECAEIQELLGEDWGNEDYEEEDYDDEDYEEEDYDDEDYEEE